MAKITVILDDIKTEFELKANDEHILDKAIDEGIDAPYSCKSGVCTTCKAKVEEGECTMDENYALTDDQVKSGYVLTCQAHPKSERVIINYDVA